MRSLFKRFVFGLMLATLLVGAAPNAMATNGMELIGVGPVIRSMGGAGSALPLDSFIITMNPAGMSELDGRFDLGLTYFKPYTEYEATHFAFMPVIGGTTASQETDHPGSFIPSLGLVYPVNDDLTLGLAAYGVAGMGVQYGVGLYGANLWTDYSMMKLVPAISYQITDEISVGVALNVDYAMMGYQGGGGPQHDMEGSFGIGFHVGVLYKPTDDFSIGLAYISPQWFEEYEFGTPFGTEKLSMDLPQQVVLGLGYEFNERTRAALDVRWINWSSTQGENQPEFSQNVTGQTFDMNWSDQITFAIGVEYDLIPETLKIRAGYNYGANPLDGDRAFENMAFPALAEHHFTAGLGYSPMENFEINLGVMYAPPISISGSNPFEHGVSYYDTSLSEWGLDLGFSYTFGD